MVEFINGMPVQRWMRLEAKRSGYAKEGSGATTVRTQDRISVTRLVERGSAQSANSEAVTAEQRLTAAQGALTSIRDLLVEARDIATSANDVGADRAGLTTEANDFISQANQIVKEASFEGKKLFDPDNPEQKMRLAVGGGGAFSVGLADVSSTPKPNLAKVEWSQVLVSTGSNDVMQDLTRAPDGSLYGTGWSTGNYGGVTNKGDQDAFVTKYSAAGSTIWTRMLGSSARDRGLSVTAGSDGSVFVAGLTDGALEGNANQSRRVFVSKFSADGSTAWTKLSGAVISTTSDYDRLGLSASGDGFVYLGYSTSGSFDGQSALGGGLDSFVTKMNASDGSTVWTSIAGSAGLDRVADLKVDSDGSVYVVGEENGSGYLRKFNSDGSTVVNNIVLGGSLATNTNRVLIGVEISSDGLLYSAGNFGDGSAQNRIKYLSKYFADGSTAWTKEFDKEFDVDGMRDVTLGSDGAAYITGRATQTFDGQTASGGGDAFVLKINADGSDGGRRTFNLTGEDIGRSITLGLDGSLYIGGKTTPVAATSSDAFLMKIATDSRKSAQTFSSVDLTTSSSANSAVSKLNAQIAAIESRLRGVNLGLTRSKAAQKYTSSLVSGFDAGIQATAPVTVTADELSSIQSTATERKRSIAGVKRSGKRVRKNLLRSVARGGY